MKLLFFARLVTLLRFCHLVIKAMFKFKRTCSKNNSLLQREGVNCGICNTRQLIIAGIVKP